MYINHSIVKDFGKVLLFSKTTISEQIKTYMAEHGYNVKSCDIYPVELEFIDGADIVLFKFVHYSTPTATIEPYYKIMFIYKNEQLP